MSTTHEGATPFQVRRNLLIMAAAAMGLYVLLDVLDAWLALPLRQWSTQLAATFLNLAGFPVRQTGTILATDRFTFDVVPACSGSTTLRVLLALGVIWCGIHTHLTWARRLICIALCVPIALMANGIRVALLVFLGDRLMEPVEGIPHVMIGVFTFVLALGTVFLLTEAAGTQKTGRPMPLSLKLALGAAALILLYAPVIVWLVQGWRGSPLDRSSIWFSMGAAGALVFLWRKSPAQDPRPWLSCWVFGLAVMILGLATLVDVNLLKSVSFLFTLGAVFLLFKGWKPTVLALPLFGILYLGFPTVTYQLTQLLSYLSLPAGGASGLALKTAFGVLMMGIFLFLYARREGGGPVRVELHPVLNTHLFLAFAGLAGLSVLMNRIQLPPLQDQLTISYLQGDWVGHNNEISDAAKDLLGAERILSRRYRNEDRHVDLLVTSTGGNRHNMHPPEYCMTGAGWRIEERSVETLAVGNGRVQVSRLALARENRELQFVYWFTDGKVRMTAYQEVLKEDMLRRLQGRRTNWYLFRVMARPEEGALEEFLASLEINIEMPLKGRESDKSMTSAAGFQGGGLSSQQLSPG